MGVSSGGATGEPSRPVPGVAAHSVMLLENKKKCLSPRASNAPIGPATHGGKPVLQVVFPLRDGFQPVSDMAALPAFLTKRQNARGRNWFRRGGKFCCVRAQGTKVVPRALPV